MLFSHARLLIFIKAPLPGQVKSRLIPLLGAAGAARLQERLTRRLVGMMAESGVCPLELWVAPDTDHPLFEDLQRRWGLPVHLQRGRDLGERMATACTEALGRARRVALIGSDCPALTPPLIGRALAELQGVDAVLGPAEDGGYVLLALKRAEPVLFEGMPWSTERVAELTRERMRSLRWRWRELPELWDLDRPADLLRLRECPGAPTYGRLISRLSRPEAGTPGISFPEFSIRCPQSCPSKASMSCFWMLAGTGW